MHPALPAPQAADALHLTVRGRESEAMRHPYLAALRQLLLELLPRPSLAVQQLPATTPAKGELGWVCHLCRYSAATLPPFRWCCCHRIGRCPAAAAAAAAVFAAILLLAHAAATVVLLLSAHAIFRSQHACRQAPASHLIH